MPPPFITTDSPLYSGPSPILPSSRMHSLPSLAIAGLSSIAVCSNPFSYAGPPSPNVPPVGRTSKTLPFHTQPCHCFKGSIRKQPSLWFLLKSLKKSTHFFSPFSTPPWKYHLNRAKSTMNSGANPITRSASAFLVALPHVPPPPELPSPQPYSSVVATPLAIPRDH